MSTPPEQEPASLNHQPFGDRDFYIAATETALGGGLGLAALGELASGNIFYAVVSGLGAVGLIGSSMRHLRKSEVGKPLDETTVDLG